MKFLLRLIWGIGAVMTISGHLLGADVAGSYATYSTNAHGPLNSANYTALSSTASNAIIPALNAQVLLLEDLVREHQKRAADLTQNNQSEKAKWETDLVNELQERSGRVQQSMQQAIRPAGASDSAVGAGNVDAQLAFVSTLESRQEQIRHEIAAALDGTRVLSLQISTNKAPEDIAALSSAIGENQRLVKDLHREQFDLELRRLEFRAISKTIQK